MDIDYVNKQLVCPTCGKSETLYIDLHEVMTDPQVNTGVIRRSFIHGDHGLLLEIDQNGDIRTIEQLSSQQEISIDRKKYETLQQLIQKFDHIVILSKDSTFSYLIERIIDHDLQLSSQLDLNNNEFELSIRFGDRSIRLIRKFSLDSIYSLEKTDCCVVDDLDPILMQSQKFVKQLVDCPCLICLNETIHSKLLHDFPEVRIQLLE